jgi:putative transposase
MDTIRLLLIVAVYAANIQDRDGAKLVLEQVKGTVSLWELIWADAGYTGQMVYWVKIVCGWILKIVKRSDDV